MWWLRRRNYVVFMSQEYRRYLNHWHQSWLFFFLSLRVRIVCLHFYMIFNRWKKCVYMGKVKECKTKFWLDLNWDDPLVWRNWGVGRIDLCFLLYFTAFCWPSNLLHSVTREHTWKVLLYLRLQPIYEWTILGRNHMNAIQFRWKKHIYYVYNWKFVRNVCIGKTKFFENHE